MTAPKHTPGPWRAVDDGVPGLAVGTSRMIGGEPFIRFKIVAADGHEIADLRWNGRNTGPSGEANAHLLAAAPSMYEALDRVEAVMSIVQPRSDTKEYLDTLRQVRAALAKAEGREP